MDMRVQLETLAEEAERIADHRLNYGGCCIFAGMVATRLRSLGIPAWCAVAGSWGNNPLPKARKYLKENGLDPAIPSNWNDADVNFAHVAVVFKLDGKLWLYDTDEGMRPFRKDAELLGYPMNKGKLSAKEAVALGATEQGWNRVFNRRKIPALQRAVNHYLRDTQ